MPGMFNPVSGNPVTGGSNPKSLRTRLGFGGNSNGSSNKPSFFSQLNLKPGRKSFGGPVDFQKNDPVLVIDAESDCGRTRQDNGVLVSDMKPSQSQQKPKEVPSSSVFKEISSFSRRNFSYSLPASPIDTHSPSYFINSHSDLGMPPARGSPSEALGLDKSGLSKHLPDFSGDLSLLMNEQPPPDTASQSDHHQDTKDFAIDERKWKYESYRGVVNSQPNVFFLERGYHDQNGRRDRPDFTVTNDKMCPTVSSPSGGSPKSRENVISHSADASLGNTGTSFDLSAAEISLNLMQQNLDGNWAQPVMIESVSTTSGDGSVLPTPSDSLLVDSGSGPVTSTPFLSPSASPSQSRHEKAEISFDLDALDPDLVAMLRPNNQDHKRRVKPLMTSLSESFAPPPDPLNPGTIVKQSDTLTSLFKSPHVPPNQERSSSSPLCKFATISASTSPSSIRQLRTSSSCAAQDIVPATPLTKSILTPAMSNDIPQVHLRRRDDEHSSPSTVEISNVGTLSDVQKQSSPLSAPPLSLADLQRQSAPSSTHRRAHTAISVQVQSPTVSILTSSIDSHSKQQHSQLARDRDTVPASTSPEVHSSHPHRFDSTGRERGRVRLPVEGLFPIQPSLVGNSEEGTTPDTEARNGAAPTKLNAFGMHLHYQDHEGRGPVERRPRKRSMSLDQGPGGSERRRENNYPHGIASLKLRRFGERDRSAEPVNYEGSEFAYSTTNGLGTSHDGRGREQPGYGYGHGERERPVRTHTEWLGPRTAKAFAAAGLLDDPRDFSGQRYGGLSHSTTDRELRVSERRSPVSPAFPLIESGREREPLSVATSSRSTDREYRFSGVRSGAVSPSTTSTRPLSRGDSWLQSRSAQLFTRAMSDLNLHRGSLDGRDGVSVTHPFSGSIYSTATGPTGTGSTGSGGGRASPTTTSSLLTAQSQIQVLKEKHDAQTEALLAALADSQRTNRELREANDALKSLVKSLEERLSDLNAYSRQKEVALSRTTRTKPTYSPDRTRILVNRKTDSRSYSRLQTSPQAPDLHTSLTQQSVPSNDNVFGTNSGVMAHLMADPPSHVSLSSGTSPPPSPTLVLPVTVSKHDCNAPQEIDGNETTDVSSPHQATIGHKRSMSGASVATSANFSFESSSPGSLKLKPEHERLLGDMTRLSLITGIGGDSETDF